MPYLVNYHGAFWFQIRVPKSLVPRYGIHVRQNLSLTDRSLVQPLANQLTSHWLTRFAGTRSRTVDPAKARSPGAVMRHNRLLRPP